MTRIDVWSDINCPFCYIGKRHLSAALEKSGAKAEVRWRAFELDPEKKRGKAGELYERLARKYGVSLEDAKEMCGNMEGMAARAGLTFDLQRAVPTNSFDAHRLAAFASERGKGDQAQEKLFSAYLCEGKDIADVGTLEKIGVELGLPAAEVRKAVESDDYAYKVRADEVEARELGINSVPFFVFNGRLAVAGAQPVDVFLKALSAAEESRPVGAVADGAVCDDDSCAL